MEFNMIVKCPHCGEKRKMASSHAGENVKCPNCKKPFAATETDSSTNAKALTAPIDVECDMCGHKQIAPAEYAGKRIKCAKCRVLLDVPDGPTKKQLPIALIAGAAGLVLVAGLLAIFFSSGKTENSDKAQRSATEETTQAQQPIATALQPTVVKTHNINNTLQLGDKQTSVFSRQTNSTEENINPEAIESENPNLKKGRSLPEIVKDLTPSIAMLKTDRTTCVAFVVDAKNGILATSSFSLKGSGKLSLLFFYGDGGRQQKTTDDVSILAIHRDCSIAFLKTSPELLKEIKAYSIPLGETPSVASKVFSVGLPDDIFIEREVDVLKIQTGVIGTARRVVEGEVGFSLDFDIHRGLVGAPIFDMDGRACGMAMQDDLWATNEQFAIYSDEITAMLNDIDGLKLSEEKEKDFVEQGSEFLGGIKLMAPANIIKQQTNGTKLYVTTTDPNQFLIIETEGTPLLLDTIDLKEEASSIDIVEEEEKVCITSPTGIYFLDLKTKEVGKKITIINGEEAITPLRAFYLSKNKFLLVYTKSSSFPSSNSYNGIYIGEYSVREKMFTRSFPNLAMNKIARQLSNMLYSDANGKTLKSQKKFVSEATTVVDNVRNTYIAPFVSLSESRTIIYVADESEDNSVYTLQRFSVSDRRLKTADMKTSTVRMNGFSPIIKRMLYKDVELPIGDYLEKSLAKSAVLTKMQLSANGKILALGNSVFDANTLKKKATITIPKASKAADAKYSNICSISGDGKIIITGAHVFQNTKGDDYELIGSLPKLWHTEKQVRIGSTETLGLAKTLTEEKGEQTDGRHWIAIASYKSLADKAAKNKTIIDEDNRRNQNEAFSY